GECLTPVGCAPRGRKRLESLVELGQLALDLTEHHRSARHEDTCVPEKVAGLEVLRCFGAVGLLDEACHGAWSQVAHRHLVNPRLCRALRAVHILDVAIPGLRTARTYTQCHDGTFLRGLSGGVEALVPAIEVTDHVVGREHTKD